MLAPARGISSRDTARACIQHAADAKLCRRLRLANRKAPACLITSLNETPRAFARCLTTRWENESMRTVPNDSVFPECKVVLCFAVPEAASGDHQAVVIVPDTGDEEQDLVIGLHIQGDSVEGTDFQFPERFRPVLG